MVMSVSTTVRSDSSPASACTMRRRPSKWNGLVTTATVRIPRSFANEAMTGAAPVPVPPPRPAVMKTMSAPVSRRVICSGSSSAASRPTSGFEPAPSPCVSFTPSCTFTGAGDARRAWLSVLATMNSTPVNCAVIMRVTALLPPPPRPMTLIFAACGASSSSNSGRRPRSLSMSTSPRFLANGLWWAALRRRRRVLEDFTEPARQPVGDATEQVILRARRRHARHGGSASTVERQADGGGVDRTLHHVGESADGLRQAAADRKIEDGFGQLRDAFHDRRAAGHDDARCGRVLEPRLRQLARDEREDLLDARLNDLGEDLARERPGLAPANRRDVDHLTARDERGQRASVTALEVLGLGRGRAQADGDVVGDVIASDRQDRRVPDGAVTEEPDVGRPAADVEEDHAELALVGIEDGFGRG